MTKRNRATGAAPFAVRLPSHGGTFVSVLAVLSLVSCGGGDTAGPPDSRARWVYHASEPVYYGSPALSADEKTVYFGTSLGLLSPPGANHAFIALNAVDGRVRWRYPLGAGQVRSTPAIADDGSIYFMVEGGEATPGSPAANALYRLSSAGQILWSYDVNPTHVTSEVGQSAPAIGADGTVYLAGDQLYAIRPDGSLRWKAFPPTYEARFNSPVIGRDGTVYFVYHNIPLTALEPDSGRVIWSCPLGVNDHCFASPAIGDDGTLYVATQPGIVYAVSPAGRIVWEFDIASAGFHGSLRSSPAVDADGAIYFGLNHGSPVSALFALNRDGSVRWIFQPDDLPPDVPPDHFDIYSSPAIGSDGTIYFGQEFGRIYALDPANGKVRWIEDTTSGITWSSPALASDGTLFIGDLAGDCHAVRTDSRGLKSAAPWPKFRFDNANGGRVH